jgi:hypothetical protein
VPPNAKALDVNAPASWETYTSSESGFTIKHPGNVTPTVLHEGEQTITVFTLVGPTQKKDTEFYDGISLQLMTGELGNETLEEYVEADEAALSQHATITKKTTPTEINGVNGYTYAATGEGDVTFIYLPDGGAYLKIANLTKDPGNLGYETIAQNMLQTLHFTAEEDGQE